MLECKDSSEYTPAGKEVWSRQDPMRKAKREADDLAFVQDKAYTKLHEETEVDRNLCRAAFEAGFIAHMIEGTLNQKEIADGIRYQAELVGVPWRGVSVEDLMETLKETANSKRSDLQNLLNHAFHLQKKAAAHIDIATQRGEMLDGASKETVSEIEKFTDEAITVLNNRKRDLIATVREEALERKKGFARDLKISQNASETILDLTKVGNRVKEMDDLGLLSGLFDLGDELEDTTINMEKILEDISQANGEGEETKGDECTAPKIEFRYDRCLLKRLALYGTVGCLSKFDIQSFEKPFLAWDESRSDASFLKLNGTCAEHVAKQDKRVTAFGRHGFSKGVAVMRCRISGLQDGHWISFGIATGSKLNTIAMISDTVILEQSFRDETSSTISNGQVVTIVLDCDTKIAEYYKGGIRIKLTVIENCRSLNDWNFFPFCTMFHPHQMVELI